MSRSHVNTFMMSSLIVLLSLYLATSPLPLSAEELTPANQYKPGQEQPEKKYLSSGSMITAGETLTLSRCIDIALMKNPNIVAAMNTVEINRNRVGEARSAYYPQLSATGSYSKINPVPGTAAAPFGIRNRFDQYSGSVDLNQKIYDFGTTSSSVDVSKFNFESSRSDLSTSQD